MKLTLSALPRDVIVRPLPALILLLTTHTTQCSILAHITNVHDLMALRLTSRLMRDCLLAAPLHLALGSSKNGDVSVRLLAAAFPATVGLTLPTQSVCLTDDALTALSSLSRLEMLDLSFASQISNDAVRSIARFERLTSLSLAGCLQVDDDTLVSLTSLSQLRLTNASILKLGETLTALEELHLGNCYRVSDAGLATLPPSLRVLNMQFVAAGDLGLGFASRLARLECLNLYGCRRVGSACMAALSGLAELRLLSLGDTSVNDEGLKHLASVPKLQRLNLYALPGLTDAGLAALRCLTTLVTLDIEYCNISEDTAVTLAGAMGVRHLNLHGCRGGDWAGAARTAAKWAHVTSRCEMYCSWHLKRHRQPRGSLSGMYIF